MSDFNNPGLSIFFTVEIDAIDLGSWATMSGLGIALETTDRGDTAMTFFQHHLPAHIKYSNITLGRPLSPKSADVINWISAYHILPIPTAGQITCLDQTGATVMTWQMLGVSPVNWKGPSMDAGTAHPATETLELAHMGFL